MKIIINRIFIWDNKIQEFWILSIPEDSIESEIWKCVEEQYFQ